MVIGEYVAILGIYDDTGAGAGDFAFVGYAEKPPKRVVAKRRACRYCLTDTDIDDGWRDPLHQRGKARHGLTANLIG